MAAAFAEQQSALDALQAEFSIVKAELDSLQKDFANTPTYAQRPAVTGDDGQIKSTF